MPRFVILEHDHPFLHWDFMLECGQVLRTWRLLEFPEPDKLIEAEPLADHRLAYLDYEGPVSGGRGTVTCQDRGEYEIVQRTESSCVVQLAGDKLRGRGTFEQGPAGRETFYFAPD